MPAGAAAGDEAGQLGVQLGDGLGSVEEGGSGCEVELPPECDADNGIVTC